MARRGHGHRACVRMILAALSLLSVTEAAWSGADGGIAAYEHGDYATAYREFLPRAQRGDAQAQLFLGLMSMTGQGVPQDQAKAVMWLRKAAEQGDDTAQNALSNLLYTMGLGDPQYLPEAAQWYQKLAEQGSILHQYQLGQVYERGRGVPQDYVLAHMWLNVAAAQMLPGEDHDATVKARDRVAAKMPPAQLAEAQRLARE